LGVAALTTASLAACGSSSNKTASSPEEVTAALRSTANQPSLELTGQITGSVSSFSNGQGSTLTPDQEQAILDSTLVLTVHAANGTNLSNAGRGGELSLVIRHNGTTLAEIRLVGSTLYAQIHIQQFSTTYGLDSGSVARFRSDLERLGSQVGGLNALNNGQWVSLNINLLDQLVQTAGITLPSVPQLVGRIVGALFNGLAAASTVGDVHNGQAQLTVSARSVVSALAQAITGTPGMSSFGSEITNLNQSANASVPNKSIHVNVTVSGGIVSNLELPVNQFQTTKPLKGPVSFKMAVAKSGAVSVPSGATPVNLPQLIHALEGSSSSS
jgi:hypothetical protein